MPITRNMEKEASAASAARAAAARDAHGAAPRSSNAGLRTPSRAAAASITRRAARRPRGTSPGATGATRGYDWIVGARPRDACATPRHFEQPA